MCRGRRQYQPQMLEVGSLGAVCRLVLSGQILQNICVVYALETIKHCREKLKGTQVNEKYHGYKQKAQC